MTKKYNKPESSIVLYYKKEITQYNKYNSLTIIDDKEKTLKVQNDNIIGLRNYLINIYKKSGYAFLATLGIGAIAPIITSPYFPIIWYANIPFIFYTIQKIGKIESKNEIKDDILSEIENSEKNKWFRYYSISIGIIIAPMIQSMITVPLALAYTTGVFTISTLYALKQKDLNLVKYNVPLIKCFGGLFGAELIQIGMSILGYEHSAMMLGLATAVVGSGIFTTLIAVQTQLAIKSYKEQKLESIDTTIFLLVLQHLCWIILLV